MAIIIKTCPKCGHDLHDVMFASYPPIPKKECWSYGWSWTGEPEEIVRIPFGENSGLIVDDLVEDLNKLLSNNKTFDSGGEFGTGICLVGSMYDEQINQEF